MEPYPENLDVSQLESDIGLKGNKTSYIQPPEEFQGSSINLMFWYKQEKTGRIAIQNNKKMQNQF